MSTHMTATRRFSTSRWSLAVLVAGMTIAALGVALALALGGRTGTSDGVSEEAARAMLVYRAGEWWAMAPAAERPAGWAAYRAGEHAPRLTAVEGPGGWAAYRAGERAP